MHQQNRTEPVLSHEPSPRTSPRFPSSESPTVRFLGAEKGRSSIPLYYRGPGKLSVRETTLALVFSVLICGVVANWTAHLQLQISATSLSIVLVGLFALVVGGVTGTILRVCRVQSRRLIVSCALLVACSALYLHWTVWAYIVTHPPDSWIVGIIKEHRLLLHPETLFRRMSVAAMVCNRADNKMLLQMTWTLEAIVVAGISVFASLKTRISTPFCKCCQEYCTPSDGIIETAPCHPGELRNRLEGRDFDFLLRLGPPRKEPLAFFRFDLYACGCRATHALSARMIPMIYRQKDAKRAAVSKGSALVLDKLLLSPHEASRFKEAKA